MKIKVGGVEIPYVEVAYDFARSPATRDFDIKQLSGGNSRVKFKRNILVEIPIPVVINRRDTGKSWDNIKEAIAKVSYQDKEGVIEILDGDGKFHKGFVSAIDISEEHEYASKGVLTIVPTCAMRYAEGKSIDINLTTNHVIEGDKSTSWKTRTVFTKAQNGYEIQFNAKGATGLFNITSIKSNYKFIEGDVLEIDFDRRLITVNSENITNSIVILKSNFKELPIGEVSFLASHRTEIKYNERFF